MDARRRERRDRRPAEPVDARAPARGMRGCGAVFGTPGRRSQVRHRSQVPSLKSCGLRHRRRRFETCDMRPATCDRRGARCDPRLWLRRRVPRTARRPRHAIPRPHVFGMARRTRTRSRRDRSRPGNRPAGRAALPGLRSGGPRRRRCRAVDGRRWSADRRKGFQRPRALARRDARLRDGPRPVRRSRPSHRASRRCAPRRDGGALVHRLGARGSAARPIRRSRRHPRRTPRPTARASAGLPWTRPRP